MTEATAQTASTTAPSKSEAVSDAVLENYINGKADTTIEGKGATFDDFDSMEAARDEFFESRGKKKESKVEKETEEVEAKAKDQTGKKTELQKTEAKTKEDMEVEPTIGIDPNKAEIKFIKGMDGDKAVDLNPDIKLKLKVDGKVQDIALKELTDNYNGKVGWDKKIRQAENERREALRKSAYAEEQMGRLKKFIETAQSNPTEALFMALEDSGADALTFFDQLKQSMFGDGNALFDMTEEQRENYYLRKTNEFLKRKTETSRQRAETEKKTQDARVQIESVRQARNLTQDEMVEAFELVKDYDRRGLIKNIKITPEVVADVALDLKAERKTKSILESIDDSLVQDQKIFNEVQDFVRKNAIDPNSSFSDQEILGVVKEILGKQADLEVARTVSPQVPKQVLRSHKEDSGAMFSDFED